MMQNGNSIPPYWVNQCATVYPNGKNILGTLIKLNEGFFPPCRPLMVKDMKKKLPPQCKLLLTRENMLFLISSVCVSIQYQSSCRCAISHNAAVCDSSTLFSLFSLDFPVSNVFALHSVEYDAMHSRFRPSKIRGTSSGNRAWKA